MPGALYVDLAGQNVPTLRVGIAQALTDPFTSHFLITPAGARMATERHDILHHATATARQFCVWQEAVETSPGNGSLEWQPAEAHLGDEYSSASTRSTIR